MQSELNYDIKLQSGDVSAANQNAPKYQNLNEERGQAVDDNIRVAQGDYDLSAAGHPVACIFTFIFKVLAVLV